MNMQGLRRAIGGLAVLFGVVLVAVGLVTQRADLMVLGLTGLFAVLAGLIFALRFRLVSLADAVEQLSTRMDRQWEGHLRDLRRASSETTGLVLRAFRDMKMASRDHALAMRDAKIEIRLSSQRATEESEAISALVQEKLSETSAALADIHKRIDESVRRWLMPSLQELESIVHELAKDVGNLPPKLGEAVNVNLSSRMETSDKLARQLIRETKGLQSKMVDGLIEALAPTVETSERLMRQLIREHAELSPKVAEALRAELSLRMDTTEKLMRQILRESTAAADRLGKVLQPQVESRDATVESQLQKISRDIGKVPIQLSSAVSAFARSSEKLSDLAYRALAKIQYDTMQEAEALIQLYGLFSPKAPMPLLGGAAKGWAMEPVSMLSVVEMILSRKPGLVVECGSGTSTIWISHALKRIGSGRLISLEHQDQFALLGEAALDIHGLRGIAEIRRAALEPCHLGSETFDWYATSNLADLQGISILIVDGPPSSTGALARYPALPVLRDRLLPGALVLIDDVTRDDEHKVVERWQSENDALVNPRMVSGRTLALDYLPAASSDESVI